MQHCCSTSFTLCLTFPEIFTLFQSDFPPAIFFLKCRGFSSKSLEENKKRKRPNHFAPLLLHACPPPNICPTFPCPLSLLHVTRFPHIWEESAGTWWLSGFFHRSASLAIPHRTSFAATPECTFWTEKTVPVHRVSFWIGVVRDYLLRRRWVLIFLGKKRKRQLLGSLFSDPPPEGHRGQGQFSLS